MFEAISKDPRAVTDIDLTKVVPSEEIPILARVLRSGNPDMMLRAIGGATEILQIHVNDARPKFQQMKPPLAVVKKEFQALVSILVDHFSDNLNKDGMVWNGLSDGTEIDEGRAENGVANIEATNKASGLMQISQADHDAMIETTKRNERATALEVLPALAHLNPMTPSACSFQD